MIELFYRAIQSRRGIKILSSDPDFLRQKLYAARRELTDPDLSTLSLVPSPANPQHLWIVKNGRDQKT